MLQSYLAESKSFATLHTLNNKILANLHIDRVPNYNPRFSKHNRLSTKH